MWKFSLKPELVEPSHSSLLASCLQVARFFGSDYGGTEVADTRPLQVQVLTVGPLLLLPPLNRTFVMDEGLVCAQTAVK